MWSVNDQLATLFDDPAQLVARLATYPKLVVMLIEQRDYSSIFSAAVFDVHLTTDVSSAAKCFAKIARKQCVGAQPICIITRHDRIKGDDLRRHKIRRGFDHVSRRRLDAADDVLDARQGAQPMRCMRKIRTG